MSSDDDDDNQFGASRKIMLVAIFCLLAVVFLIIFLHIYSKYLLRRQEMRRRATIFRIARQVLAQDPATGSLDQGPPKSGVEPSVISSLPVFPYKANDHDHIECSICLGVVGENVMVKLLPNCKHMFHVECIDMWLGSNSTCPICRTTVEPTVQQHEVNGSSTGAQPSAPPLGESNPSLHVGDAADKGGGVSSNSSRFGSFRWMMGRERSRVRSFGDEIGGVDIERQ